MINWYKYLLTETEEYKLDPQTMNKEEFDDKYIQNWNGSETFRNKVVNDIIKLEIDNNFKQLSRDHQHIYYRIIVGAESIDDPVGDDGYRVNDYVNKFMNDNFSNKTAVKTLTSYPVFYLLKKYFGRNTKDVMEYFDYIKTQPLNWYHAYRALYSNFESHVPTIPKISYVSGDSISDTKKENIKFLKKVGYVMNREKLVGQNILDTIKLTHQIGSGYHGRVFGTEDGRALKIFGTAEDLNKDLRRMKKIEKNLYSGLGSLEDMTYFETGKLGDTGNYYSLMPEIIPLTKAPFYEQSAIFNDIANMNKGAAKNFAGKKVGYKKFKDFVINSVKENNQNNRFKYYEFDEEYENYSETIEKIIQAGYRAYTKFGGIDLHGGNIGYIRQKPDVFFYYDM